MKLFLFNQNADKSFHYCAIPMRLDVR